MERYTVATLSELAVHFLQRAEACRDAVERAKTESLKRELRTAAQVWREAAEIVRKTTMES